MKLGERVKQASAPLDLSLLEPTVSDEEHVADVKMAAALLESETFSDLKAKVQDALLLALGNRVGEPDLADDELKTMAVAEMTKVLEAEDVPLSENERQRLVDVIAADLLGYGPIQPLLSDPRVSEIMVNGTKSIYIEKNGRLKQADIRFNDEESLRKVINRIVAPLGRRIDESSPMVDARLPDGSRVCAVIPPLAVDGSSLEGWLAAVRDERVGKALALMHASPGADWTVVRTDTSEVPAELIEDGVPKADVLRQLPCYLGKGIATAF